MVDTGESPYLREVLHKRLILETAGQAIAHVRAKSML